MMERAMTAAGSNDKSVHQIQWHIRDGIIIVGTWNYCQLFFQAKKGSSIWETYRHHGIKTENAKSEGCRMQE